MYGVDVLSWARLDSGIESLMYKQCMVSIGSNVYADMYVRSVVSMALEVSSTVN